MTFLEYLQESEIIEWPRDVNINVDTKIISQTNKKPNIGTAPDDNKLIPFGKKSFNDKAFDKLFAKSKGSIIGYKEVIEFFKTQSPKRLELLDKLLSQIYNGSKGMTFQEVFTLISNDNRISMLNKILDQLEGKTKQDEKPWFIGDAKSKNPLTTNKDAVLPTLN